MMSSKKKSIDPNREAIKAFLGSSHGLQTCYRSLPSKGVTKIHEFEQFPIKHKNHT